MADIPKNNPDQIDNSKQLNEDKRKSVNHNIRIACSNLFLAIRTKRNGLYHFSTP